jgi:hypothetical protein
MRNTRKLYRLIISLCLMLAVGAAPALTAHAQQPARTQVPPKAERSVQPDRRSEEKKRPAAEEDVLLSDAEMEGVKGGVAWFVPVAIGAAFAAGSAYLSHRSHRKIMEACRPTRR